jgi:hypothetical protein
MRAEAANTDAGGRAEKRSFIIGCPDFINSVAAINSTATLAWIDCDLSSIFRPRQNTRKHRPCVIGLPTRFDGEPVAPIHEDSSSAAIRKRRQREVGIFRLNLFLNNALVVVLSTRCELAEILTRLICLQKRKQPTCWHFDFLCNGLVVAGDELWRSRFAA